MIPAQLCSEEIGYEMGIPKAIVWQADCRSDELEALRPQLFGAEGPARLGLADQPAKGGI
jgi:hypothetical protein